MSTELDEDNQNLLNVLRNRIRLNLKVTADNVTLNSLTNKDCIILLMGPPRSGKKTFMEVASGTQIAGHKGSEHPDTHVSAIRLSIPNRTPSAQDPNIVLVYNPGFNDVGKSDGEILRSIADWLQERYQHGIHVGGAIFFQRISDAKTEGTSLRNWRVFENICGVFFKNVVLATTMWGEEVSSPVEQEFRDFLGKHPWRGWTTHRFHHLQRESVATILAPIIDHQPAKRPLLLQTELCDLRLSLNQTSAARALYAQLEDLLHDTVKKKKDVDYALKQSNITAEELDRLLARARKFEALITRVKAAQNDLKETVGKCLERYVLETPVLGPVVRYLGFGRQLN